MSFISGNNQTSIPSDAGYNKYSNEKGNGEIIVRHVNLKHLKQQKNKIGTPIDNGKYYNYIENLLHKCFKVSDDHELTRFCIKTQYNK